MAASARRRPRAWLTASDPWLSAWPMMSAVAAGLCFRRSATSSSLALAMFDRRSPEVGKAISSRASTGAGGGGGGAGAGAAAFSAAAFSAAIRASSAACAAAAAAAAAMRASSAAFSAARRSAASCSWPLARGKKVESDQAADRAVLVGVGELVQFETKGEIHRPVLVLAEPVTPTRRQVVGVVRIRITALVEGRRELRDPIEAIVDRRPSSRCQPGSPPRRRSCWRHPDRGSRLAPASWGRNSS